MLNFPILLFIISPLILSFRAAVYETMPKSRISHTREEALSVSLQNLKILSSLVAKNPQKDIHVFSEYGITGTDFSNHSGFLMYAYPIPTLTKVGQVIPITQEYESSSPLIYHLAVLARSTSSYIIANIPDIDKDGRIYNSNVAVDRKGNLVSKYHKIHLFIGEDQWCSPGSKDQLFIPFKTDFGQTFGMFICFDIFFADVTTKWQKLNITSIAYSTYWVNQGGFPLATGAQVQHAFAHISRWFDYPLEYFLTANNAQGFNSTGCGIFSTQQGVLNYTWNPGNTIKNQVVTFDTDRNNPKYGYHFPIPDDSLLVPESFPSIFKIIPISKSGIYSHTLIDTFSNNEEISCSMNITLNIENEGIPYPALYVAGGTSFNSLMPSSICGLISCPNADCSKLSFGPLGYTVKKADISFVSSDPSSYTRNMYFIANTDKGAIPNTDSSFYNGFIANTHFGFETGESHVANFFVFSEKTLK